MPSNPLRGEFNRHHLGSPQPRRSVVSDALVDTDGARFGGERQLELGGCQRDGGGDQRRDVRAALSARLDPARPRRSCSLCPGLALAPARQLEKIEKMADLVVGLGCVPHLEVSVDVVAIAPPDLLTLEVAGLDQIGDDPLRCPFGDPDHLREISEPNVGILSDTQQDLRVVREEPPVVVVLA
jgi:hypothetical protein